LLQIAIIVTLTSSAIIVKANESLDPIDFKKIQQQKNIVNYTLDQIVTIIEDSIRIKNRVIIPANVTEFERALFQARLTQNNRNQFVAIKQFKTLLEFKCYRTKGEELYIKLLLATSLDYLGAPFIANNYIKDVFPAIFNELHNDQVRGSLSTNYANLLIQIDSVEQAKDIYLKNLSQYESAGDTINAYKSRNNLGYSYALLLEHNKAKQLYRINQNKIYKNVSPIIYAFSFGNYGSVLLKQGDYDSALYYMRKEIHLLNSISSIEGINNTYLGIGDAYLEKNELDSARSYFQLSVSQSKKSRNIQSVIRAYGRLIKLYAAKEKAPELGVFIDNYLIYNDSLQSTLSLKKAQEELQVSEFLNIFKETQQSKNRYDDLQNKTENLIVAIIGLGLIIILMVFTLSFYFTNRKSLKNINLELKDKNQELEKSYQIISDSNEKNQVLLKELHHRVKNNLQIISSLFNLQLNASDMNVETEGVFKDAKNRIYSISLVHKKIYQSDNVNSLDFEEYLRDFSDELLNATPNDVNLSIEILRNPISIDSAISLGLIFNELFTNSIKHAKRHDSLQINVTYEELDGKEKFIYTDNGIGVKNTEIMRESGSSIGVTLIHLLGKQLDATIDYKEAKDGEHGFWLSIEGNFS
jgi:two-component sensor histidine kinase